MADMDVAAFTEKLDADQKAFFEKHVTTASEAAVTKFKTDDADARKKSVPEKYELKFAEKSPLDTPEDREKIAAYCKQNAFSNEQAQAYVAQLDERASALTARHEAQRLSESDGWKTKVETDKELGGQNFAETQKNVTRVMDRFVPKDSDFRKFLNDTGFGNHPEVVRFVNAIGKAMAEDRPSILGSGGGQGSKKEFEPRSLYPNSKMA